MKKIITFAAAAILTCYAAFAQDDAVHKAAADAASELSLAPNVEEQAKPKYWKSSLKIALGYNMTNLSNWAAGGYNTTTLNTNLDAQANYKKDLMSWNNRLQLDYGFLNSDDKKGVIQKSNDRIYFESKWAYQTVNGSAFNYTASFNFLSQFSDTPAEYIQNSETAEWEASGLKSAFISPAYTDIALGIQWKPSNYFDVNFAPLTGGLTICSRPELRPNYGMKPLKNASDLTDGHNFNSVLFQFGAQVKVNFKASINDNFTYETQAVVFTDYLHEPYFRVNWDNSVNWQISKYVAFSLKTWLISDPNVTITLEDGSSKKRGVQFKDFISFNFTYTFASK